MKRKINGRTYNTDTAEAIYWYSGQPGGGDIVNEVLYKTKKGEYFLSGEGGYFSEYGGRSIIKPLTLAQAKVWGERRMPQKDYAEEFGEPRHAYEIGGINPAGEWETLYTARTREDAEDYKAVVEDYDPSVTGVEKVTIRRILAEDAEWTPYNL